MPGEQRDDTKRFHPSLRPWADLTKEERDKDRQLVLDIPVIVDAAGMSMAQVDELSTEAVARTEPAARAEASGAAGTPGHIRRCVRRPCRR